MTDPKYVIKDLIDSISIKKDDDVTDASLIFLYEGGPETLKSLLTGYDVVVTVGDPVVRSTREIQDVPVHHPGTHPVKVQAIDKYSSGFPVCTATKIVQKMREQIRSTIEGSAQTATRILTIVDERPHNRRIGGMKVCGAKFSVKHKDVD